MIYDKKLEFQEAKQILEDFFENESPLFVKLTTEIPNLRTLIKIMLDNIEFAIANSEAPKQENTLLDGDIERLTYFNYLLPSYYLEDKYDNFYDLLTAYLLLVNNYAVVYKDILTSSFLGSIKALNNLTKLESNFTRLIEISSLLISKYEKTKTFKEEPFSITKSYLKAMYEGEK